MTANLGDEPMTDRCRCGHTWRMHDGMGDCHAKANTPTGYCDKCWPKKDGDQLNDRLSDSWRKTAQAIIDGGDALEVRLEELSRQDGDQ